MRVRGVDEEGEAFRVNTVLDNISTDGLYLRLPRRVKVGAKVSLIIWFADSWIDTTQRVVRLAARGVVMRADPLKGGTFGYAVGLTRKRFLKQ